MPKSGCFCTFINSLIAKRSEKIQNKKNKFLVFSIEGNESSKKRGRPPKSEEEKIEAKRIKLEKDRERLRKKRMSLLTPEKKILDEQAKKRMSEHRASLLTPDKKMLKEKAKKGMFEYRASLLSPDKKVLKEGSKKRMSILRGTMPTPLKRVKREEARVRMNKMRRSLNFIKKTIQRNKDKIAKKVKYEVDKDKILARKRENYRIRVILDAISKIEKIGQIDKRILKALPGFNKKISEYLLDTQAKRQKAFTNNTISFSLLDAILLSKISSNLKTLYLKGDMEIHKLLDILFLANNEYIRINPKSTDYKIFLEIYESVVKV
jgi:hypothetical protein